MTSPKGFASALAGLRHHRQTLAGVLDQGVVGFGNLAVGLLVLRTSTKEDYGLYSLCYTTLILLNGFANALFVAQLTVSYHERPHEDRDGVAASMLCGQWLLAAGLALAGLVVEALLPDAAISPETRRFLFAATLACPAVMAHDFLRGYFFLVDRALSALVLDLMLALGWFGGTVSLGSGIVTSHVITSHVMAALAALGLSACVTACTGLALSRLPLRAGSRSALQAVRDAWGHGRWALGGAAVTALQNQAHVYLLGWLASAKAIAEMNAARMLMMPMGLLIIGIGRTLVPAMARQAAEGRWADMNRRADRTLIGVVVVIALYSGLMALGHDALIGRVLGKSYDDIGPLVALWMVILLLQAVDANLSAVLQVAKRFRALMMINVWTVGPVLICVVPMIMLFGAEGNLVTLAGGYVAVTLLLWRDARRTLASLRMGVVEAPSASDAPVARPARGRSFGLGTR